MIQHTVHRRILQRTDENEQSKNDEEERSEDKYGSRIFTDETAGGVVRERKDEILFHFWCAIFCCAAVYHCEGVHVASSPIIIYANLRKSNKENGEKKLDFMTSRCAGHSGRDARNKVLSSEWCNIRNWTFSQDIKYRFVSIHRSLCVF